MPRVRNTWNRLPTDLHADGRLESVGDAARSLLLCAWSFAGDNLTDGFFRSRRAASFCDDPETAIADLLRVGILAEVDDGYQLVDYLDVNDSAEQVQARIDRSRANAGLGTRRSPRVSVSPKTRIRVFERDGFRCVYCGDTAGESTTIEVDHIIPVSRGGTSNIENLQTLCAPCNAGKSDRVTTRDREGGGLTWPPTRNYPTA